MINIFDDAEVIRIKFLIRVSIAVTREGISRVMISGFCSDAIFNNSTSDPVSKTEKPLAVSNVLSVFLINGCLSKTKALPVSWANSNIFIKEL